MPVGIGFFLSFQKHPVSMRLTFIYYTLFFALLIAPGCQEEPGDSSLPDIQSLIDSLRLEYAPDKRVAIWEIAATDKNQGIHLKGTTNLPKAKEQLQTILERQQVKWIDSIQVLPGANLEENIYGIVTLSACNIRSRPAHSGERGHLQSERRGYSLGTIPGDGGHDWPRGSGSAVAARSGC